jgi:hypothetical protein
MGIKNAEGSVYVFPLNTVKRNRNIVGTIDVEYDGPERRKNAISAWNGGIPQLYTRSPLL